MAHDVITIMPVGLEGLMYLAGVLWNGSVDEGTGTDSLEFGKLALCTFV